MRRFRSWKNDLRNCWWSHRLQNRQSLDGVGPEGLFARVEKIFEAYAGRGSASNMALQTRRPLPRRRRRLRDWIDASQTNTKSAPDVSRWRGVAQDG